MGTSTFTIAVLLKSSQNNYSQEKQQTVNWHNTFAHLSSQSSSRVSSCLLKCFNRDLTIFVVTQTTQLNLLPFLSGSMFESFKSALATRARLGHHVRQLPVLHLLLVYDQHAHGHVLVRYAWWRGDVPDAQVVDDRLDDGVVGGMVAVVEHPRAVAPAESWVVHRRSDEVVTPAELVEGQPEGVELAAVLGHASFAFVVRDIRNDGGSGGGGKGGRGGSRGIFQNIQWFIFGLRAWNVFGAAVAVNRGMPLPYSPHDAFSQQVPHQVLHLPFFLQV